MSDENPYRAPDAVLEGGKEALYEPAIFTFSGRIGRLRYLAYGIGVGVLLILLIGIFGAIAGGTGETAGKGAAVIAGLGAVGIVIASMVITIMYGKRRFNDLNHSGWWSLLLLIPYLQLLPLVYLVFFPGSDGSNRYGPAPVKNSIGVRILGLWLPLLAVVGIIAAIAIPAYHEYVTRAG